MTSVTLKQEEVQFQPITLEITLTSEEDLHIFWVLTNTTDAQLRSASVGVAEEAMRKYLLLPMAERWTTHLFRLLNEKMRTS